MIYTLETAIPILERTPAVLRVMLQDLKKDWTKSNEGGESWSPFDIVGHLLHGEKTDWIERVKKIIEDGEEKTFTPFDRFAQLTDNKGKTLEELLTAFAELRAQNLNILRGYALKQSDFHKKGIHPALGEVSLKNLLATWVVHDLNHLAQLTRVMAHQYRDEVGPWKEYLPILSIKK